MITKISKLVNFGVFQDFKWEKELPELKKFNLIFGWNRSGKTSISRVFESLEKHQTYDPSKFKRYPRGGEFEIKLKDGKSIKDSDVSSFTTPVKVFNQDFLEENISFEPTNPCNPIIYISAEDIESKNLLEKLRTDRVTSERKLNETISLRKQKEDSKNTFLTSLGREVANILFDKAYNKTKVEAKITSVGLENFKDNILSEDEKKRFLEIAKSEPKIEIQLFQEPKLKVMSYESCEEIFAAAKALLDKQVTSVSINRLKADAELNSWTKTGFELHRSRQESEKCLFCQNPISASFLDSLSKHFNDEYCQLQEEIEKLISSIKESQLPSIELDLTNMYPDLFGAAKDQIDNLVAAKSKIEYWLKEYLVHQLTEKSKNPFNNGLSETLLDPEDYDKEFSEEVEKTNSIIAKHNEYVLNHSQKVGQAKEKIELHSIAVAIQEQDYTKMQIELIEASNQEQKEKEALGDLNRRIQELENKTSNIALAIPEINKHLKDFFGKVEIELKLDSSRKGYIIKRDGKPADNLSEGEKTAIAFSYFIVKVTEKDNKINESIIFIDDPISSFDSNFIYHCFALITNYFNDPIQFIISTHNFQLLNLIKEWLIKKNSQTIRDNEKLKRESKPLKETPAELFMVENFFEAGIRKGKIIQLDNTLKKFKSEYHFLFSLLNKFKDEDLDYADFYTISNVARRFFDIYADFKIPDTRDQKSKMEAIVNEVNQEKELISKVEMNKAYKLLNEYSHNSDPTSTIEHKDKIECKEAINIILKIVKLSDSKHFEILEKEVA